MFPASKERRAANVAIRRERQGPVAAAQDNILVNLHTAQILAWKRAILNCQGFNGLERL